MALSTCPDCGGQVSTEAPSCPHCGRPTGQAAPAKPAPARSDSKNPASMAAAIGCLSIVGLFGLLMCVGTLSNTSDTSSDRPKTSAELRTDRIEKQFSSWDGSHRGLERHIKASMNDPDSYDHEETVYWDKGDHLLVRTTFRGKNAFGGTVKNSVMAKVSLDGKVLEIVGQ